MKLWKKIVLALLTVALAAFIGVKIYQFYWNIQLDSFLNEYVASRIEIVVDGEKYDVSFRNKNDTGWLSIKDKYQTLDSDPPVQYSASAFYNGDVVLTGSIGELDAHSAEFLFSYSNGEFVWHTQADSVLFRINSLAAMFVYDSDYYATPLVEVTSDYTMERDRFTNNPLNGGEIEFYLYPDGMKWNKLYVGTLSIAMDDGEPYYKLVMNKVTND